MKKFLIVMAAVFSLGLLISELSAAEKYSLKTRFPEGKYTLLLEMDMKTAAISQEEDVEPQIMVQQKQIQTIKIVADPIKEDGTQKVAMKFARVQVETDTIMGKMKYDSDDKESKNSPLNTVGIMVGLEFMTYFDKDGNITKIEGVDEFFDKLIENAKVQEKPLLEMFKKEMSAERMAKNMNIVGEYLPKTPVEVGESWENEQESELPLIGEMEMQINSTLKSVEKENGEDVATILSKTEMSLKEPKDLDVQGMGVTFSKMDVKSDVTTKIEVKTGLMLSSITKMEQIMQIGGAAEEEGMLMQNILEMRNTVTRD
ncbi:MAG: DUF6263 family protein [Planctomycetia bacterium]|nr:DUF6263 family protein [Planctomycetia bacterium]